jgi:hypothetical protein
MLTTTLGRTRARSAAILALVAVLGWGITATSAAPAAQAATRCAVGSGTTVLQTHSIRVYTATAQRNHRRVRHTYGCVLRASRRTELPNYWGLVSIGDFVAASQLTSTGTGDIYGHIRLFDLRAGRKTADVAVGGFGDPRAMSSIVVSAKGSLAWIENIYWPSSVGFRTYEVHVIAPGAPELTLDSGPDIDPTSLAASLGQLYWTKAGVAVSTAWN